MLIPRTYALDRFVWPFDRDGFLSQERPLSESDALSPTVDVEESEESFTVLADLPGVEEKDIDVTVDDSVLAITAERESSRAENGNRGHLSERRYGKFVRKFRLGSTIDSEGIKAGYKNGVLSVVLPKKAGAKSRQISVSAG